MTLPKGWVNAPIGDLCELVNGKAFKPSDWTQEGLPIIRIQNLNRAEAAFNHCSTSVEDHYVVEPGELLFAWSGTPGTSFGAHIWKGPRAVLNQHIFRVRFDSKAVDRDYFRFAINSTLQELISKAHGGVGLAHVTKGKFEATTIPLPSIPEQRRIVAKLGALTERLVRVQEDLNQVTASVRTLRDAGLGQAFAANRGAKDAAAKTGRTLQKLGEAGQFQLGKMLDAAKNKGTIRRYVRNINVRWLSIRLDDVAEMKFTDQESATFKLLPGDILVCEGGEPGRAAVWTLANSDILFQKAIHRIRPTNDNNSRYIVYYLLYLTRTRKLQEYFTGSTIKHLPQVRLMALPFPKISRQEQDRSVACLEAVFRQADRLEAEAARARALLDRLEAAILARAFRGELVPQDPNDEPASVLLDRIRAQRAAAPKPKRGRRVA